MTNNVGQIDRILRIVAGLVIIAAGIYFGSWLGAIGIIPLFTGSTGWCPLYTPLGISTTGDKPQQKPVIKSQTRL
ncbi:MAG: DUF2892 domain-containing protein [Chlorobiales bacterium]|nr:DUF2892 domain-containing protein [Chlorobiales bacterium]